MDDVNVLLQVDPVPELLAARRAAEEGVLPEVHHLEVPAHAVRVEELLAAERAPEGAVADLDGLGADQLSQLLLICGQVQLAGGGTS